MTPKVSQPASHGEERAELEAVLASGILARAPNLALFLSYVCRRYFDGETDRIKEYSIAVEALGRPPHFDQKSDAIVRVEAHRLRKRLREFYEGDGAAHALEICLPPGSYVPVFRPRGPETTVALRPESQSVEEVLTPEVLPARQRSRWWIAAAIASIAAAGFIASRALHSGGSGERPARPALLVADSSEVRILAGAPGARYLDRSGHLWQGDQYFAGGRSVARPAQRIARTADPEIYQAQREGDFRYDIPLKPGIYELRLYFAEAVFGAGNAGGETSRLFDITANGTPLLSEFDVFSDAGGSRVGDIKVFKDIAPAADGVLHLLFRGRKESAILSGVEILPATAGHIRPIRILAQEVMYVDRQDRVWSGDRYFNGGQTVVRELPVTNVTEPTIYRGERYGNFTYTIPVAPGRYNLTLRFAETWFGPKKQAGGGVGSRLFDIYCNGVALLKNFDIYKEAGGSDLALDRTFQGLEPNAQGKLVLSFVPVRNYACVNAIEVE